AGNVVGDAFVGRAAHEAQGFANAGFGQQIQVGGLLELDGEGLLQGSVEHGIAGGVDEVGENDGVFFGEGGGAAGAEEQASGDEGSDQYRGGGDGGNLPGFLLRRGNSGRRAALGGTDECVRPY